MRLKIGVLIVFSLFTGLLCGCREVPDKVKENMKEYGDNECNEEVAISYYTVDELKSINNSTFRLTGSSNIEYPDYFDFSRVEEIGTVEFEYKEDYCDEATRFTTFFEVDESVKKDFIGNVAGFQGVLFDDVNKENYLYVGDNGDVSFVGSDFYNDASVPGTTKTEKLYFMRGDKKTKEVKLNGAVVDLKELVGFGEKCCEDLIEFKDISPLVRTAFIRRNNDGNDTVSLNLELLYKGVVLDCFGSRMSFDSDNVGFMDSIGSNINIVINKRDSLAVFTINGVLEAGSFVKEEKLVDFQSAVKILEKELSTFNKLEIVEIEPVYVLHPIYDYKAGEYYAAAGNKVIARPVYSFLIEYGDDDNGIYINEDNGLVYVNVDMVTGELTTNFENRGFRTGEGE